MLVYFAISILLLCQGSLCDLDPYPSKDEILSYTVLESPFRMRKVRRSQH